MKFVIVTHAAHIFKEGKVYAYGPYVREMNLWAKFVDEIIIVAPMSKEEPSSIHLAYAHSNLKVSVIPAISLMSFSEIIRAICFTPIINWKIFVAFLKADHIHLRCPGNIGLLGAIIQIFFPKKMKTAKYAGNWDPKAIQPLSYRLQKKVLCNTFLTKNMQVLVYGDWPGQTKNVKSFFTATYSINEISTTEESVSKLQDAEKIDKALTNTNQFKFLYVGALTAGKQPLLSVQIIRKLIEMQYDVHLELYGEGEERSRLSQYIHENDLLDHVTLHGNVSKEALKDAYKWSDFLLFISKSEGWPKVVAEAMFWGCLPLSSRVSCVPNMLDYGNRGALVDAKIDQIVAVLESYMLDEKKYKEQVKGAITWSRQFTLEKFEAEIGKLIYFN
jgi:glycosyltransferase involved in cell wall biosynthesis